LISRRGEFSPSMVDPGVADSDHAIQKAKKVITLES
jgi:hypothetical protein